MDDQTLAWWNERATRHADTPMYRPLIARLAELEAETGGL